MSDSEWCLIESDPGVFTELIRGLGCTGVEVEEIWSLDESLAALKPIHGMIFLFKCENDKFAAEGECPIVDTQLSGLFFAKQVIHNACASLAILNLLMNVDHTDVVLGETLENVRSFSQSFNSKDKGAAIGNSDVIRNVHNSFSKNNFFEFDRRNASEKDESYHFIAYIPFRGRLYELDGLKDGPVDHGAVQDDWVTCAAAVIQKRMSRYASNELRFTLLSVISERRARYQRELADITSNLDGNISEQEADNIHRLTELVQLEEDRHARYRLENIRRRHNYVPFLVELLRILGEKGLLDNLLKNALERSAKKEKAETK